MKVTRWGAGLAIGVIAGMLALAAPAQADESYTGDGPVDLSASVAENVGERISVGHLDLQPGAWSLSAEAVLAAETAAGEPAPGAYSGICELYLGEVTQDRNDREIMLGGPQPHPGNPSLGADPERPEDSDPNVTLDGHLLELPTATEVHVACHINSEAQAAPRDEVVLQARNVAIEAVPALSATVGKQSCEQTTITFANLTEGAYDADVRVDGEKGTPDDEMPAQHDHGVKPGMLIDDGTFEGEAFGNRYRPVLLEPGTLTTWEHSFEPGSGEHTIEYRIWRGPENDYYVPWQKITVDCPPPGGEGGEGELPETGNTVALIGGGALALLAVGGGLFLAARRRRISFTS